MGRKNNRSRRKARRERKEGLAQAERAFAEKYPSRGSSPTALMLNIIEQSQGRWASLACYRESVDPLSFDVFLMKKQAELRRDFFRNNKWREGVEALEEEGWGSDRGV